MSLSVSSYTSSCRSNISQHYSRLILLFYVHLSSVVYFYRITALVALRFILPFFCILYLSSVQTYLGAGTREHSVVGKLLFSLIARHTLK